MTDKINVSSLEVISDNLTKIISELQKLSIELKKQITDDDDLATEMEDKAKNDYKEIYTEAKRKLNYDPKKWSYSLSLNRPFYIDDLSKNKLTSLNVMFNNYMLDTLEESQRKYYRKKYPNRFK